MNWDALRRGKAYDLAMGLPLILWFGYGAVQLRPNLVLDARDLMVRPDSLLFNLRFFALAAAALFNLLLVWLVVVRENPVRRARGIVPRLAGFAGTFLGVGILHLRPVPLSPGWQIAAAGLTLAGGAASVLVLAKLGKSFSIMPEARQLVTDGPYRWARHPLYAVEMVTILGTAIQFRQPWAGLLALAVTALLVVRSHFEEEVLAQAYPEYESYRARVKRFGLF